MSAADHTPPGPASTIDAGGPLPIALAALLALQAGTGLTAPGLYRDEGWIAAAWFGNDLVTLLLALPVLVTGAVWLNRGGGGAAWMLLAGATAYGVYNGAFYLLGATLNIAFPLYVAISVLSALTLGRLVLGLPPGAIEADFPHRWQRRFCAFALLAVGSGLGLVWLMLWARTVLLGVVLPIDEPVFRLVAAIDLVLLVPVLLAGGGLLLRRAPWGPPLASMAATLGALYLTVLTTNSAVLIARGYAEPPGELPVWGALLALILLTALLLFRVLLRGGPAR
ncbi:MAG: hypothetical protein QNJ13_01045 [Paracoccaceae bacterium]|nr:hypothetical protein [Paracoccaceae bacterium]